MFSLSYVLVALFYGSCESRIVGNYKLWDSAGNALYDFSRNHNHADIESSSDSTIISTDRGIYASQVSINFPKNSFSLNPNSPIMHISFWCLPLNSSKLLSIHPSNTDSSLLINLKQSAGYIMLTYSLGTYSSYSHLTVIPFSNFYLESWNFFNFKIFQTSSSTIIQWYDSFHMFEATYSYELLPIADRDTSWSIGDLEHFRGYLYQILWRDDDVLDSHNVPIISQLVNTRLIYAEEPYHNSYGRECSQDCIRKGLSCSKEDINICISCPSSCNTGCYDFTNIKCIAECTDNCICEANSSICISCASGYELFGNECFSKDDKSRLLVDSCSIGYYACDATNQSCCPCPAFCNSCYINSSLILECTQCAPDYKILVESSSSTCVSLCPSSYFLSQNLPSKCEKCESNCHTCTSDTQCTTCSNTYFLKLNDCVSDCGTAFYNNVLTYKCDSCSNDCDVCNVLGTELKCTKCKSLTLLKEDECVSSCGDGYTSDILGINCEKCPVDCKECKYEGDEKKCSVCVENIYYKDGVCATECGSGYFSDSIHMMCLECSSSGCDQCGSDLECSQCITGLGLQNIDSVIVCAVCPKSTFLSTTSCINCITLCETCANSTTCNQCVSNATQPSGYCVCKTGYKNVNGECVPSSIFSVYYAYLDTSGKLKVEFNGILNSPPKASNFFITLGSNTYDSSSFTLYTYSSLTGVQFSFPNLSIYEGHLSATVIFPTSPNALVSTNNLTLAKQSQVIPITSDYNKTLKCDSILNCLVCMVDLSSKLQCTQCESSLCRKIVDPVICTICCEDGFYKHNTIPACLSCSSKCNTCDNMGCLSCKDSKYLLNRECVTDCGLRYYKDQDNMICQQCISNCEECNDGIHCLRCRDKFVVSTDRSQCSECPARSYYNNGSCTRCPDECESCLSINSCSVCIENAEMNASNICVCKPSYFYMNDECTIMYFHLTAQVDSSQKIQLTFDKQLVSSLLSTDLEVICLSTTYRSQDFTLSEYIPYQLYSITIPNLSLNNFSEITLNILTSPKYAKDQSILSNSSISMIVCPIECSSCDSTACLSCVSGYYSKNESCVKECGLGYIENTDKRMCKDCPAGCEECQYVSVELMCYKCIEGWGIREDQTCRECLEGSYLDSNQCKSCTEFCKICTSSLVCDECIEGYLVLIMEDMHRCVVECPDGYYQENKICIECMEECKKCTRGTCLECNEGMFRMDAGCVTECRSGYFEDLEERTCRICSIDYCKECSYMEEMLECTDCIDGYYVSYELNLCLPCMNYCNKCSDLLDCDECQDEFFMLESRSDQTCVSRCPEGYYSSDGKCISCSSKCMMCISESVCNKCKDDSYLISDGIKSMCVTSCPEGFYDNKVTAWKCIACTDGCMTCSDSSSCSECITGYYQDENTSLCLECPSLCSNCEKSFTSLECTKCKDFAYLDKSQTCHCYDTESQTVLSSCPSKCPEGMIPDADISTCIPTVSESLYSDEQIQQANTVEYTANIAAYTSSPAIALSIISTSQNSWDIISTIQIFSFMSLLAVKMPLFLQKGLVAQKNYLISLDIFSDLEAPSSSDSFPYILRYQNPYILMNTGKFVFILLCILGIHFIFILGNRFANGKAQELFGKGRRIFEYGIYLKYFISMYIEYGVAALLQLVYVIPNQPADDSFFNISNYLLALLITVALFCLPGFLLKFLMTQTDKLKEESVKNRWGVLYYDLRFSQSKLALIYYFAFMIRRSVLSISFITLVNYPLAQVIICSVPCLIVSYIQILIYVAHIRPFVKKVDNILNILYECCITIGYSCNIFFVVDTGVDSEIIGWIIIACINITYLINIIILLSKLILLIYSKVVSGFKKTNSEKQGEPNHDAGSKDINISNQSVTNPEDSSDIRPDLSTSFRDDLSNFRSQLHSEMNEDYSIDVFKRSMNLSYLSEELEIRRQPIDCPSHSIDMELDRELRRNTQYQSERNEIGKEDTYSYDNSSGRKLDSFQIRRKETRRLGNVSLGNLDIENEIEVTRYQLDSFQIQRKETRRLENVSLGNIDIENEIVDTEGMITITETGKDTHQSLPCHIEDHDAVSESPEPSPEEIAYLSNAAETLEETLLYKIHELDPIPLNTSSSGDPQSFKDYSDHLSVVNQAVSIDSAITTDINQLIIHKVHIDYKK